jgi:hypothetical protein
MNNGQIVRVRQLGNAGWLNGEVLLVSPNQKSLILAVDEGVPAPYQFLPDLGCQILVLGMEETTYVELSIDRRWEIEETDRTGTRHAQSQRLFHVTHE